MEMFSQNPSIERISPISNSKTKVKLATITCYLDPAAKESLSNVSTKFYLHFSSVSQISSTNVYSLIGAHALALILCTPNAYNLLFMAGILALKINFGYPRARTSSFVLVRFPEASNPEMSDNQHSLERGST